MTTEIPIGPGSLIVTAIDAAEELRDPLDRLVEKTAIDPGAPFAPDVLERLATLKKDDRGTFESLRAQLKEAGCRVTALDEAIANGGMGRRDPAQADVLIDLAQSAELFHAADGTGFADLDINGTGRLGRSAAKRSVVGWRAASSRRQRVRPIRRRCNRR